MHINMSWWYVKHDRLCYMGRMVCHGLFCDTAKEEFSILYFWVVCWQNIWTFCRWHKSNKKAQGCMKAYTSSSTSSSGCGGSFLAKILPSLVDTFVQLPHASYGRSKPLHCSVSTDQPGRIKMHISRTKVDYYNTEGAYFVYFVSFCQRSSSLSPAGAMGVTVTQQPKKT